MYCLTTLGKGVNMKSLILVFIFVFVTLPATTSAGQLIRGKLLGSDGKPMKSAIISYRQESKYQEVKVNPDGSFEINSSEGYFTYFCFSGSGHYPLSYNILNDEKKRPIDITIRLSPITVPDEYKSIVVIGNFNRSKLDSTAVKMVKINDSLYSAVIPCLTDTLYYMVAFDRVDGGLIAFAAPQSEFYKYDDSRGYYSGTIANKKPVAITLNLAQYPKEKRDLQIDFNDKKMAPMNLIFDKFNKTRNFYISERMNLVTAIHPLEYYDSALIAIKKKYLDSIGSQYDKEKNREAKKIMLGFYFYIAGDGSRIIKEKSIINKRYAKDLFRLIPWNSPFWGCWLSGAIVPATYCITGKYESDYITKVINSHPLEYARGWTAVDILKFAEKAGDSALIQKYCDIILEQMPGTDYEAIVLGSYNKNMKVAAGKALPDFNIVNLDNAKDTINNAALAGKYTLIDLWNTSCGNCILEMPYLHEAYRKYHSKGFEILSIAFQNQSESVVNFREGKWKMPWLNACTGEDRHLEFQRIFECVSYPKYLLVGPDGKIIQTDRLRRKELDETLAKIFEGK